MRRAGAWLTMAAAVLAGCETGSGPQQKTLDSLANARNRTFSIRKLSGDEQTDTVLATLAAPLRVQVLKNDHPVAGVAVTWAVTNPQPQPGSATVEQSTTVTDASGVASVRLRLGKWSSTCTGVWYAAEASVTGASGSPAAFKATAIPGTPVRIAHIPDLWHATGLALVGDTVDWAAAASDDHALSAGPVERVVPGNLVAGVTITWAVASGGGSIAPVTLGLGGCQDGVVHAKHVLGPDEGPQRVTATAPGLSPISFTAHAVARLVVVESIVNSDDGSPGANQFREDSVAVPVGATVGWVWGCQEYGCSDHNVTFEDAPTQPTSSATQREGNHSRTFSVPGTYRYRCTNHSQTFRSGMVGMVVVR